MTTIVAEKKSSPFGNCTRLEELYAICMSYEKLIDSVNHVETVQLDLTDPNYPVFVIANAKCSAKVALHGAHLFEWTPTGQEPVIYNSPDAIYQEGKAIRGGVPVCWPWFNAHPTDPNLPSHGFARNRFWELEAIVESGAGEACVGTMIHLVLKYDDEIAKLWPFPFTLKARIELGAEAKITIEATNESDKTMMVGGALHTYLSVGHIDQVSITGLEETSYIDTAGPEAQRTQTGPITISAEVDRIYLDTEAAITLYDEALNRKIEVTREGSKSAVVWNPWIEKAKGLSDLPDEAYYDFVCIEAANARNDLYPLEQHQTHTLSTTIKVL